MKKDLLLRAALAGLSLGLAAPATSPGQEPGEVKCYGVNSCGSHASCAVSDADIAAVRKLLGSKEFERQFGKSETHACGAHAKCGSSAQILNWTPTNLDECHTQGGLIIEEKGGKKVAKKA